MSDRMVTIYKRKDGRIYLHHHQKSSMGINLACPPFIKIEPPDVSQLPKAINDLLVLEPEIVPHPKTFNQLDPLFEIAECHSWKEFAKGTHCFLVLLKEGEIELIRTKRDGAGFKHLSDPVHLGTITELGKLLSLVPELA